MAVTVERNTTCSLEIEARKTTRTIEDSEEPDLTLEQLRTTTTQVDQTMALESRLV